MAFIMRLQVVSALMVALVLASGVYSSKEGESVAQKAQDAANKAGAGGLPMLVLRQGSDDKPDLWLGFLNWSGNEQLQQILGPYLQQIQPMTQQMTSAILGAVPNGQSLYDQFNQFGNQISGMNPMGQLMGGSGRGNSGSGSASSSPLSNMPGMSLLNQLMPGNGRGRN